MRFEDPWVSKVERSRVLAKVKSTKKRANRENKIARNCMSIKQTNDGDQRVAGKWVNHKERQLTRRSGGKQDRDPGEPEDVDES